MSDCRHFLIWDESQYLGYVGINNKLICCIVDTGAHRTIIDTQMAAMLGLPVKKGGAEYGKFSVPGSEAINEYAGVIEGSTTLHITDQLGAKVENMRVIHHPRPFMLLGADVLSGGRNNAEWNFTGLRVNTL